MGLFTESPDDSDLTHSTRLALMCAAIAAVVWYAAGARLGLFIALGLSIFVAYSFFNIWRNKQNAGPHPSQFSKRGDYLTQRIDWLTAVKQQVEETDSWEEKYPELADELRKLHRELKVRG